MSKSEATGASAAAAGLHTSPSTTGTSVHAGQALHRAGTLGGVAAGIVDLERELHLVGANSHAAAGIDRIDRELDAVDLEFSGRGKRPALCGDHAERDGAVGGLRRSA